PGKERSSRAPVRDDPGARGRHNRRTTQPDKRLNRSGIQAGGHRGREDVARRALSSYSRAFPPRICVPVASVRVRRVVSLVRLVGPLAALSATGSLLAHHRLRLAHETVPLAFCLGLARSVLVSRPKAPAPRRALW